MTQPEPTAPIMSTDVGDERGAAKEEFEQQEREREIANLGGRIDEYLRKANLRCEAHEPKIPRWNSTALAVAWAAAALAAVTGLSIVANQTILAGLLAVAAALCSTFLATVKPAETAADHKTATAEFRSLATQFEMLEDDLSKLSTYVHQTAYDYDSGQYYEAGYYLETNRFKKEVFDDIEKKFRELILRYDKAIGDAPSIKVGRGPALPPTT